MCNNADKIKNWVLDKVKICPICQNTGIIKGLGLLEHECKYFRHKITKLGSCIWKRITHHPFKSNPVAIAFIIFLSTLIVCIISKNSATATAAIAAFGAIFTALKYKLDQASFNRSLFEQRYKIFCEVQQILFDYQDSQRHSFQDISKRLDAIYRESYFLFEKRTLKFLIKFRHEIINCTHPSHRSMDDMEAFEKNRFLINLKEGQKLADYFPELKLGNY